MPQKPFSRFLISMISALALAECRYSRHSDNNTGAPLGQTSSNTAVASNLRSPQKLLTSFPTRKGHWQAMYFLTR